MSSHESELSVLDTADNQETLGYLAAQFSPDRSVKVPLTIDGDTVEVASREDVLAAIQQYSEKRVKDAVSAVLPEIDYIDNHRHTQHWANQ